MLQLSLYIFSSLSLYLSLVLKRNKLIDFIRRLDLRVLRPPLLSSPGRKKIRTRDARVASRSCERLDRAAERSRVQGADSTRWILNTYIMQFKYPLNCLQHPLRVRFAFYISNNHQYILGFFAFFFCGSIIRVFCHYIYIKYLSATVALSLSPSLSLFLFLRISVPFFFFFEYSLINVTSELQ